MKISKNFIMQEFMPPDMITTYGDKCRWYIRKQIIELAQFYRDWFEAPVYINTWHNGGNLKNRGFRMPDSSVGSYLSQHKFGNAFDCHIKGLSADGVRKEILDNQEVFMDAGLTTLESGAYAPTWVHSDCRETELDHILIVKPRS